MADVTQAQERPRVMLAKRRAAGLKLCHACRQEKPFAAFSVCKTRCDGLQPKCKACYAVYKSGRPRVQPTTIDERYPLGVKRCLRCGEAKPTSAFAALKIPKGELRKMCEPCHAEHRAAWEKASTRRKREWQKNNPEWMAAYYPEWCKRNPDKVRHKAVKSYYKHRAKRMLASKKYRLSHPDVMRAAWRRKRARRKAAPGRHTAADVAALLLIQKSRCAHPWCRVSLKKGYHVDHMIPLARGGSDDRRNLQLLCAPCNIRKQAKHPVDFARENGMLV